MSGNATGMGQGTKIAIAVVLLIVIVLVVVLIVVLVNNNHGGNTGPANVGSSKNNPKSILKKDTQDYDSEDDSDDDDYSLASVEEVKDKHDNKKVGKATVIDDAKANKIGLASVEDVTTDVKRKGNKKDNYSVISKMREQEAKENQNPKSHKKEKKDGDDTIPSSADIGLSIDSKDKDDTPIKRIVSRAKVDMASDEPKVISSDFTSSDSDKKN